MLPLVVEGDNAQGTQGSGLPFKNGDYIFLPDIRYEVESAADRIRAFRIDPATGEVSEFAMTLGELTDDERQIILDGCLINYYRTGMSS